MGHQRREALVYAIDRPRKVRIVVRPGVPQYEERVFWHDDDFAYSKERHGDISEKHRKALTDAATYVREVADRYHCSAETNY